MSILWDYNPYICDGELCIFDCDECWLSGTDDKETEDDANDEDGGDQYWEIYIS